MLPILALLVATSHAPARTTSAEVCVWPQRALRTSRERPAVADPDGWSALRAALRLSRPRPVDAAAVIGAFPWVGPPAPTRDPVAVEVQAAQHPDDPGRSLVWVGARAATAPPSASPRDILVVVDASASMASVLPGWRHGDAVKTRRDLVALAVEELAARLGPEDHLGVIGFDRGARVLAPAAPGGPSSPAELLAITSRTSSWRADPVSLTLDQHRAGADCVERRMLVLSDGGGLFGRDPERTRRDLAASALTGATWSAVTVAGAHDTVHELEELAWLGHGLHARVETPHELRAALRDALGPRPTVARDLEWTVAVDAPHRVVFAEAAPREVPSGATWSTLVEVAAGAPAVDVRWSAGSPVPGAWQRAGGVATELVAPPFAEAPADVRMAWVVSELLRWTRGEPVDLARLSELASDAARPGHEADQELARLLEQAAERVALRTDGSVHAP